MRIEGGSQNLSRIPGDYVYPKPRYNPNPVEGVSGIPRERQSMMQTLKQVQQYPWDRSAAMEPSRPFIYHPNGTSSEISGEPKGQYLDLIV